MPNAVLQRLVSERESAIESADEVLATCEDEERDPSAAELDLVRRYRARAAELDESIAPILELEETRGASSTARAALNRAAPPAAEAGAPPAGAADEVVYRTFAEYARDAIIARNDRVGALVGQDMRTRAVARLERALVNTISSDVPGLIPAQHMAQILDVIDASRPIVQASRRVGLSSGKLTWPSITGRPSVSKQTAEKTETTSTKMTVAMLEKVADTFLGAGDLSWQTINWSTPDALALWFDLAAEAYAQQTEAAAAVALDAAATVGPITVESDDLAGWLGAIAAASAAIRTTSRARPNTVYFDVATGYKVLAMVGETSPVFVTGGSGSITQGTGNLAGLAFVISDELPTPTAIVGDASKLLCAETPGAPVEMRAVEPSIGGMEVGVIGAFAAANTVAGTFAGLTAPVVP